MTTPDENTPPPPSAEEALKQFLASMQGLFQHTADTLAQIGTGITSIDERLRRLEQGAAPQPAPSSADATPV